MSLQLDPRRLAMLQAMGITLWVPESAPVAVGVRPAAGAAEPTPARPAAAHLPAVPPPERDAGAQAPKAAASVPAAPVRPAPSRPVAVTPAASLPVPAEAATAWQLAPAVCLYPQAAQTAAQAEGGPWLILLESTNPTTPLVGAVGQLLDKMLQALGLHTHPQVWLAVLQRPGNSALPLAAGLAGSLAPVDWLPLPRRLESTLAQVQPARVLLLGQKVAQTVLQRSEPVGQLRQQRHLLHGIPAAVSYDPSFLLRTAQPRHYKGQTWADLQFAARLGREG